MFIKQYLARFGFALFVALAAISGSANAITPDGETPANEGVCDPLQGGTSGLYGLCVAYCEAQDLNTLDNNPPSLRILANYNKKKLASDINMPCVSPQYSCFNQDELNSIITTNQCQRYTDNSGSVIQYGVQDGSLNDHFVKVDTRAAASCVYVDITVAPSIVRTQFTIDAAQAQAAHDAINNKCVSLGL